MNNYKMLYNNSHSILICKTLTILTSLKFLYTWSSFILLHKILIKNVNHDTIQIVNKMEVLVLNEFKLFSEHKIDIPNELFETFKTKPIQKLKNGQVIYWQGEIGENFYYLKKGRVKIFVVSEDGLEKNLTIYENGSIFGEASFFDGLPRMSSAKTLSNSEIVTITKSDIILCFKKEPSLALNFIELLSQKVRMLSNQIDKISFWSAEKRIAQCLLNITSYNNCSINYTHEDIGKTVGVSRVTVSRTLNKFSQCEWIDTKYKKILILNKEALLKFLEA